MAKKMVEIDPEFEAWYRSELEKELAGIMSDGQKAEFMAKAVNIRCKAKYRNYPNPDLDRLT